MSNMCDDYLFKEQIRAELRVIGLEIRKDKEEARRRVEKVDKILTEIDRDHIQSITLLGVGLICVLLLFL